MHHIGHLGSSVLLLPAALALIMALFTAGWRRDGMALAAAIFVCIALTIIAKLVFHPCDAGASEVESPSGHASLATAFYGCLALILAGGRQPMWRAIIYLGAATLILMIGLSRIVTNAHSLPEVGVGAALGLLPIVVFAILRGPGRRVAIPFRYLAVGVPVLLVGATAVLVVARHWTPEPLIEHLGDRLDALFRACG